MRQRDAYDCGLAVTASISGLSYRKVAALDATLHGEEVHRGLATTELAALLRAATQREWTISRMGYNTPAHEFLSGLWAIPGRPAVVLVRDPKAENRRDGGHYVVWDGKRVLDPAQAHAMTLEEWTWVRDHRALVVIRVLT